MKFAGVNPLDSKDKIVLVIGNEKGGAGKTTTAMHTIASFLSLGFKVASIDVDSRQKSLTRYIENREQTIKKTGSFIPLPRHFLIPVISKENNQEKEAEEERLFIDALEHAKQDSDFVIIDTPGNNTFLSSLAHSHADIIVTPMNDSFIDLDVIGEIDDNLVVKKLTHYSQMVWQQKMKKASRSKESIDWIILRNRLSNIDAKNKRNMTEVLEKLSARVGFRHLPGFSERVIFRELFLQGLTLLDLSAQNINMTMSHIAARQELRNYLKGLNLKSINDALQNSKLLVGKSEVQETREEMA